MHESRGGQGSISATNLGGGDLGRAPFWDRAAQVLQTAGGRVWD